MKRVAVMLMGCVLATVTASAFGQSASVVSESSGNRIGHADAIAAAVAHGVVVHVVCRKSWWGPSMAPPVETFVGRLAEQTGGLLRIDPLGADRIPWDGPARVFRDIVGAIHNTYEIRLNVTGVAEGANQLEVRTGAAGVRVHAPAWLAIGASRGPL